MGLIFWPYWSNSYWTCLPTVNNSNPGHSVWGNSFRHSLPTVIFEERNTQHELCFYLHFLPGTISWSWFREIDDTSETNSGIGFSRQWLWSSCYRYIYRLKGNNDLMDGNLSRKNENDEKIYIRNEKCIG